jgi:uncharacterized protein (TIGR03437 family)
MHSAISMINRRRALALFGGAGVAAIMRADTACVASSPAMTEGPYWIEEKLFRSDIRTDPATGVARPGVPLNLSINVQNACAPLAGALIDIWHCDASGLYSDEAAFNPGGGTGTVSTAGQKFLRGYQITDDAGQVKFLTIYPGWYSGRTIHIHVRVRTYSGATVLDNFTTQLFFDDTISNAVLSQAPYTRSTSRDTTNARDGIYGGATGMLLNLTKTDTAYDGAITIGVNLKAPAAAAPAIAAGGIANAAGGAAGVAPNAWTSIYGSNLASTTHAMTSAEVINGKLPTQLGGVGVKINGKDAYVYFVSPAQVNVLAPADSGAGPVSVTVANAAGTSPAATATLQAVLPGLFTASNYVHAAAKSGDVIDIYGTGFGPTQDSVDLSAVFTGAYPLVNPVSVAIGGIDAAVQFAGLVGPGLYQINASVPIGLAAGDYPVVANVAGLRTQSGALLKITVS